MFSPDVERALRVAIEAHAGQGRKGAPDEPYVIHPVHVAMMLARIGADDIVLQAALLHDVIEDCDGYDEARLASDFGPRVAGIVAELTEDKSRPWAERKQAGIDAVARYTTEAALVKAADKLHNLESMARALAVAPELEVFWSPFHGGRERTLEMSGRLVEALSRRVAPKLARALDAAYKRLIEVDRERAGAPTC